MNDYGTATPPALAPAAPPVTETVAARTLEEARVKRETLEAEEREKAAQVRIRQAAVRLRKRIEADTPEARVLADACAFLRAGGSVSWDRWSTLGPTTKRVLELAGNVVGRERAAALVSALKPPVDEKAAVLEAGRSALAEAAGRVT